ncbi:MAG: hypothetical protein ABIG68_06630 [Acidobacteriota bacterium]
MGASADRVALKTGLPKPAVLVLGRLQPLALGAASGLVCSLWLSGATIALLLRGGDQIGRNLSLLAQYLPGFSVTWGGAAIGVLYAAILGFGLGYAVAVMRNGLLRAYVLYIQRRAEQEQLSDILDRML